MYGTVAKLKLKPGNEERFLELSSEYDDLDIPGYVGDIVYRSDKDPNVYFMVVLFETREDYVANAESAEQNERYLAFRDLLAEDPEWNDGEVIYDTLA